MAFGLDGGKRPSSSLLPCSSPITLLALLVGFSLLNYFIFASRSNCNCSCNCIITDTTTGAAGISGPPSSQVVPGGAPPRKALPAPAAVAAPAAQQQPQKQQQKGAAVKEDAPPAVRGENFVVPSHKPTAWKPGAPSGKKRLFFTISSGHSGTMFLTRALRCAYNMTTEHEEKPAVVGFPQILRHGLKTTYMDRQAEKLPALLALLDKTGDHGYADISHMFVKSWGDVVLDWLQHDDRYEINVIVLRRWLPHVLRSFLLVDVWRPDSMLSYNGGEYTVHHRNFAILPPIRAYNEEDSVSLAMGYLVDMELQLERFKRRYPFMRLWDLRSEDLFAKGGVRRLITMLGLVPNEKSIAAISTSRPVNQHVSWKAPEMLNVSETWFLARAQQFYDEYAARGIPLPHMPSMYDMRPCAGLGGVLPPPEALPAAAALPPPVSGGGLSAAALPALGSDGGALDATLVGNAHGARASAVLAASLGVLWDADALCPLPLPDLGPEAQARLLLNASDVPHNRAPVPAAVWEANRVREQEILARLQSELRRRQDAAAARAAAGNSNK